MSASAPADLEKSIRYCASPGGEALKSGARRAPTYFVCFILTIFLLLYGSRMVQGGLGLVATSADGSGARSS